MIFNSPFQLSNCSWTLNFFYNIDEQHNWAKIWGEGYLLNSGRSPSRGSSTHFCVYCILIKVFENIPGGSSCVHICILIIFSDSKWYLLVGGLNSLDKVSLYNWEARQQCELHVAPFFGYGLSGTFLNGVPIVCGAQKSVFSEKNQCFTFDKSLNQWTLVSHIGIVYFIMVFVKFARCAANVVCNLINSK